MTLGDVPRCRGCGSYANCCNCAYLTSSNRITTTGELWNGPRCSICGKGYIGVHECSPADLLRKIADLYDRLPKTVQTSNIPTQSYADTCACNPANGGSGVCGCVLGGPIVTCSAQA